MTSRVLDYRDIEFGSREKTEPLLDVAELRLPEGIVLCGLCRGHAQYLQNWCDAPRSAGACDMCRGAQFVYEATAKPVPRSVRDQIANANPDLVCDDTSWTAYRVAVDYGGRLFHRKDISSEMKERLKRRAA